MKPFRGWVWHNWLALGAFAVSCFATWDTYSSPVHLGATNAGSRATVPRVHTALGTLRGPDPVLTARLVQGSVEHDPFSAERTRAHGRFRPRGADGSAPPPATPEMELPPAAPPVVVILRGIGSNAAGTVLVAVEINGTSRLMRVGEEFGGYRLLSAGGGEARFRGPAGPQTVRINGR